MTASFDLVTIDSSVPDALAAFWCAAIGLHESQREDDDRWIVLSDVADVRRIGIQRGAHRPGGVHLDLRCEPAGFAAEVSRLRSVGAGLVGPIRSEPYGCIANMVDPEGNAFDLCAYGHDSGVDQH